MNLLELKKHEFVKLLLADSRLIAKDIQFKITDIELPPKIFNEWQYYIHNVGFYTIHLLHLCHQLNSAIDFISNYNYKGTESTAKRIEHLEYNLENFIIRLASIKDRTLQMINAVFHTGIHEADVSERTLINNLKIERTRLPRLYQKLAKEIKGFSSERNTIVHRHTYLDKEIRKLHIFYSDFILGSSIENRFGKETFKWFRAERLKKFLHEKKNEMKTVNDSIFEIIWEIFTEVKKHYIKVKNTLN